MRKQFNSLILLITVAMISSCSSNEINVNYSSMPESFELGSELPDFSRYISINKGEEVFDVSALITTNINMSVVGDYLLNIDLSKVNPQDESEIIEIKVKVVDTTPPRIDYVRQFLTVNYGNELNTDLITCEDLSGCEITYENFGYQLAGKNRGRAIATDIYGNSVVEEIEFTVIDNTSPTVEIHENRIRTAEGYAVRLGSEFELPSITISDKEDPNPIIEIESNVRTDELGVYKVSIFATDSYGNRTVKYLNYHVVENLQINLINASVVDVLKIPTGQLVLTRVFPTFEQTSGNPFISRSEALELSDWNRQVLSFIDNDYKLIWSNPLSQTDIRSVLGIRYSVRDGIYLFGNHDRESNGLSRCLLNTSANDSLGTILKYDFEGNLISRSTDFGDNCSSAYYDMLLLNNRIYVISQAYVDLSNIGSTSYFGLVTFDLNLNELSNMLLLDDGSNIYKRSIYNGTGIPLYRNSLWVISDFNEISNISFTGQIIKDYLIDLRYDQPSAISSDNRTVVTTYENICGQDGNGKNKSLVSNGRSIMTFSNVLTGSIVQGACDNRDAILVVFDDSNTLLSLRLSDFDLIESGSKIVSLGIRDNDDWESKYIVYTSSKIIELNILDNELELAIYDYDFVLNQVESYYSNLNYTISMVKEPDNQIDLYSSLVLSSSIGSSILILK